jgi:hypothetical protein
MQQRCGKSWVLGRIAQKCRFLRCGRFAAFGRNDTDVVAAGGGAKVVAAGAVRKWWRRLLPRVLLFAGEANKTCHLDWKKRVPQGTWFCSGETCIFSIPRQEQPQVLPLRPLRGLRSEFLCAIFPSRYLAGGT